jgi:bisphosphoglycerate-dependent phosphoglycerate mutase
VKKHKQSDEDKLIDSLKNLTEKLKEVIPYFEELQGIEFRDEEEEQQYQELKAMIISAYEAVNDIQSEVGEKLFAMSLEVYYHIKKQAEAGDETAKEVYARLKPQLQAALLEQIEDSLN